MQLCKQDERRVHVLPRSAYACLFSFKTVSMAQDALRHFNINTCTLLSGLCHLSHMAHSTKLNHLISPAFPRNLHDPLA
jgi:hypothetical protein